MISKWYNFFIVRNYTTYASYKNEEDNSKLADLIHDFTCRNPILDMAKIRCQKKSHII